MKTPALKKLQQVIAHCIAYGAMTDGKITKTKLAKLVYLVDFANFYKFLVPMTGFEYKKLPYGLVTVEFFDIGRYDGSWTYFFWKKIEPEKLLFYGFGFATGS